MSMNKKTYVKSIQIGTLLFSSILIIIFSLHPIFVPFKKDIHLRGIMNILGGMLVIVLLVERLTEIIISIFRQPAENKLKNKLKNNLESKIAECAKDLSRADELVNKLDELIEYKTETKNIAFFVGFSISVIICCSGVGMLGEILVFDQGNSHFLRGLDIVLTSGLIAGGSDNFHHIVSTIEAFFKESKKRLESK